MNGLAVKFRLRTTAHRDDRPEDVLAFRARAFVSGLIGVYGNVAGTAVETLAARRPAAVPARVAGEAFPRCAHQMNPLSFASHSGIVNVPSPLTST